MIKTIRQPQISNDNGNNMDIQRAISGVITKYPIQQSFDFAFDFQPDIEDYNDNLIKLESRRYIGNKSKLANWIIETILTQTGNCNSFFDIFAGTATVSKRAFDYFKKVVVNDILYSNNIIYKAFFKVGSWNRKKIEDLIVQYNILNPNELGENYFSENFGGKFFDYNNAKIIGYIREDIENKKAHLTEKEYSILLATLIYNIDKIANTVGHFDAYIKKPFQNQKLQLRLIETIDFDGIEIHKENANSLASKVTADVAYIDPPYNSRQYSRFYHIYENLVKWEKPQLFGVALKPPTENMSRYCTVNAKKAFNELIEDLNVKYIAVSYNNTYNSKSNSSKNKIRLEEIEEILKRKGDTTVFEHSHNFFNTGKTEFNDHKEFLFITKINPIHRKPKIYRSPLFYVGDKFKLIPQIQSFFPGNINRFIEPFTGGGSVFLNVRAKEYFLNDIDSYIFKLHKLLLESAKDQNCFMGQIDSIIDKYSLSKSYREDIVPLELKQKFKKTYYAQFNKMAYGKLRNDFNENQENILILYILLIYGFNRMTRFNSAGKFNLPVGNVDFNKNVVDALNNYFQWTQNKSVYWFNLDYVNFISSIDISKEDFIYLDPPYLITSSEYNKLWDEEKERRLLEFLDSLNSKGFRFAISNVTHYKGKRNGIFTGWAKKYITNSIKSNYISYHDNSTKNFQEVLVTNYGR
ncbi:MAG: Dam family site-specific DNA-(adenine-N6)-methyltransferase [Deltaproteobacteria bacterium]|jgi:adenine-specific DNA-methyltransferase|nr:Dam family site-specific DNA-(adenine-N6)-methyltransferase [Deltaproteobacteria bacterium]MCL5879596.1 Dam family site-specific DNA-(adenine-N6)-methyltransferase [Deltaproteobacteria bacterium]